MRDEWDALPPETKRLPVDSDEHLQCQRGIAEEDTTAMPESQRNTTHGERRCERSAVNSVVLDLQIEPLAGHVD